MSISASKVEAHITALKTRIENLLQSHNEIDVLNLVALCASMLYRTNICYTDADLERFIQILARYILQGSDRMLEKNYFEDDRVLFYDGFGLNDRGLAQIYLKAIASQKKIIYVTHMRCSQLIPDILNIIQENGGAVYYLEGNNPKEKILQLNEFVKKARARHFFYYSTPNDVTATTLLYAYEDIFLRYQINLTDHAYWLGTGCLDICIEFREYGASISQKYRNIPREKIVLLPFYPNINRTRCFEGFPFDVNKDQKVIFSGGALYKTMSEDNAYYRIVDYLLENHQDAIFWYAGSGDDRELTKLIKKYPGRLFFTSERRDLFQLLQHCYFYLSTYPVCGGLMYQYAAAAGKIPLTLRFGEDNEGFLLNQHELGIEFDTIEELKREMDRLMMDESYTNAKNSEMQRSVITSAEFDNQICHMLAEQKTDYKICITDIDTTEFCRTYLKRLDNTVLTECYWKKDAIGTMVKQYPFPFICAVIVKIVKKARKYF